MSKRLNKLSKQLSYYLRHKPEEIGLVMNSDGWVGVNELIALWPQGTLSVDDLVTIVNADEKQRYEMYTNRGHDGAKALIRAVQGHSTAAVECMEFELVTNPPAKLYHGTAAHLVESIREHGLLPGARQFVHLSADYDTAVTVGARHGNPVVLTVDAETIAADARLFKAVNGVYLAFQILPGLIDFPE